MTILKFPSKLPPAIEAYIGIGMHWAVEEVVADRDPIDLLEAEHLVKFPPSAGAGRGTAPLFLARPAPADHDDGGWAA
jgi:hypothetical protein